jgi:hypothetical protein
VIAALASALWALGSAGVFVAVPITGSVVLGRSPVQEGFAGRLPLIAAVGISLWSIPLLGSLILQVYRPPLIGLAGWTLVAVWLYVRRGKLGRTGRDRPASGRGVPDDGGSAIAPRPGAERIGGGEIGTAGMHAVVLGLGLIVAGVLYAAAPSDPTAGGRDMAVYANHAVYMVHHGRLDLPYPAGLGTGLALPVGWPGFSGVYDTQPTLTVQFAHVFPAWLAQTYAVAGFSALLRVNAVIGVLSALAIFAVARIWMPQAVAVLAALFLAFNAGQVWVVRNTLTEPLTQLLIWAAFLLLVSPRQVRPRASAAWAGALLGVSALVHLDNLLLLPLAIIGHALVRAVDERGETDLHLTWFYLAALPTFAIACGYYFAFSNPYAVGHAWLLWLVAAGGGIALALLGLSFLPPVRKRAARWLAMRRSLVIASGVILLLAVFDYYIRPRIRPFALLPRDVPIPPRSYIEEAMRNLGTYITPIALAMAIVGWVGAGVVAVSRRATRALPLLVIIGGFSTLYFWNQQITPDHFWAIRRFVPVIMPGAVIFAAVTGAFVLSRVGPVPRRLLFALASVALIVQTWRIGTPMFFVAERSGAFEAIQRFAQTLPSGTTFLGPFTEHDAHTYGTTLFMDFDKDVVPIAIDKGGRDEVIARLRAASPKHPIPVISELADNAFKGALIARLDTTLDRLQPVLRPMPQKVIHEKIKVVARMVIGVSTLDLELGPRAHWLVEQTGFYPPEDVGDHMARWTNGDAQLAVPIFGRTIPRRMVIELETSGPAGAPLEITYEGSVVFSGQLRAGPWAAVLDLPRLAPRDMVHIELRSTTFKPADVLEGSRDIRRLGVMVRSLKLLG